MVKFLFLILLTLATSLSQAVVVERIVAIVNSEIVTLSELKEFRKKLKEGGLVDDTLLKAVDKSKLQKSDKAVLDFLIKEKIIDSEITKQNLQVTIERVEQEIRTIAKKNGIDRSKLKQALKAQGVDFSEYQDFIKFLKAKYQDWKGFNQYNKVN